MEYSPFAWMGAAPTTLKKLDTLSRKREEILRSYFVELSRELKKVVISELLMDRKCRPVGVGLGRKVRVR